LLRPERVPDHLAAATRAGRSGGGLAPALLRPAHAADLPRLLRFPRGFALRGHAARRALERRPPRRRLLLRHELLQRVPRPPVDFARALVVARGRGAVLPDLAVDLSEPRAARSARHAGRAGGDRRRGDGVALLPLPRSARRR